MSKQVTFRRNMKKVIGITLEEISKLPEWHIAIENKPYQKFTMEVIDNRGSEITFAMDHWITVNGDLCSDPDVTFRYNTSTGEITPLSYQNMVAYTVADTDIKRASLLEFMVMWSKNLVDQGFGKTREESVK